MKAVLVTGPVVAALALLAGGCGSSGPTSPAAAMPPRPAAPHCAYPLGWQKLANRIAADVYCPGWLPDPLTAEIGGKWNNVDSVSRDRSYLESFVWQETQIGINGAGGELHVNLRGYPGKTAIPTCLADLTDKAQTPCFADPKGRVTENGITATLFTVNQDADQWHLLLAWRHKGSLYTVSEHLAPPLDYRKDLQYLRRELRSLVLVSPSTST